MDRLIDEINDIKEERIALPPLNNLFKELEKYKNELNSCLKFKWVKELLNCNEETLYEIKNNKDFKVDHWGGIEEDLFKNQIWLEFNNYKSMYGHNHHMKFKNLDNHKYAYKYLKQSKDLLYAIQQYKNIKVVQSKINKCKKDIELYKTKSHLIYITYSPEQDISLEYSNKLIKNIKEIYGWKTKKDIEEDVKILEMYKNCQYRKTVSKKYGGFSNICSIDKIEGNGCFPCLQCKDKIKKYEVEFRIRAKEIIDKESYLENFINNGVKEKRFNDIEDITKSLTPELKKFIQYLDKRRKKFEETTMLEI